MEPCYICLDPQVHSELIAPCSCSTYVHRSCLEKWRLSCTSKQALTHCPTCRSCYLLEGPPSLFLWILGHSRVHVAVATVALITIVSSVMWWLDVHIINSFVAKAILGHPTMNSMAGLFYTSLGILLILAFLVAILFRATQAFLNAEGAQEECTSKSFGGIVQNFLLIPIVMSAIGVLLLYLVLSGEIDLFASVKSKLLKQYPPRVRNLRPRPVSPKSS